MSIKDQIKQARRPETSVDICLRGDLAARYDELATQLEKAERGNSLAGNPLRTRITAEMEQIRAEMVDATVTFRLRAIPRKQFQVLWDEHPPRRVGDEVDERDDRVGFNRRTFPEPLIRACLFEPVLDEEDWKALFDDEAEGGLTDGQFTRLYLAALALNRREVDVPFSPADSPPTPD